MDEIIDDLPFPVPSTRREALSMWASWDQFRSIPEHPVCEEKQEFAYASNGKLAIGMPAPKKYEVNEKWASKMEEMLFGGREVKSTISVSDVWEAVREIPMVDVPETESCPDCDGRGEYECPYCGHWDECSHCEGEGVIETGEKAGEALDENHFLAIQGKVYNPEQFICSALALAKIEGVDELQVGEGDGDATRMKIGECELTIMPVFPPGEDGVVHRVDDEIIDPLNNTLEVYSQ